MEFSHIRNSFRDAGLKRGDFVVMHADAIVSAQLSGEDANSKINLIYEALIELLSTEGTLVVPDFTYCSTRNELFSPAHTPSRVGLMSEIFRSRKDTVRSKHPIFSFSAIGRQSDMIAKSSIDSCFGSTSVFASFHKNNAKIIYLGCSFDRLTFVHYVEESTNVSYRYHKKFKGKIIDEREMTSEIVTDYFVRELKIDSQTDLSTLKKILIKKGLLKIANFGRFELGAVKANDFYDQASLLISKDEFSLIKQDGAKL